MPPGERADPSPSFRFHVILNIQDKSNGKPEGTSIARFTECGGLDFERDTFDYAEGGMNSHVHRFPGRFKFSNLTLKKGVATDGEAMWKWIQRAVQAADIGEVPTQTVTVALYDLTGQDPPLRIWNFLNAYPVKWSLVALSADQNAIAIETLTLAHQGMDFAG
jgi:phage tail-like protein